MKLFRLVATYFFVIGAYAVSAQSIWSQLGADIEGGAGDGLGTTLSVSADGTIIAAGAPSADAGGGTSSLRGLVKVYMLESGSWTQMGSTINGTENGAAFGASISISDDGTLLAIGAPYSASTFGEFSNSGQVKIYSWNAGSSDWDLEETIEAEAAGDNFGYAISISGDGSVIAIGAPINAAGGDSRGTVRVYNWDGSLLTSREDLDGAADFDSFGTAVSLNFDGSVLAVGAPSKSGSGGELNVGQVTTYSWNTTTYSNTGTLDGVAEFDTFGDELSLSDDGTRLAVSATKFLGGTTYVELFDFSTSWSSIGAINSANDSDGFGNSISLSGDGSHVAIGASSNVTGSVGGRAEVYAYSGAAWEKVDTDIVGEAENDGAGTAVSISADGAFVAVGAPNNVAGGVNAGQVKVYELAVPDLDAPTVAITSEESSSTKNSPFAITITFSEEVSEFVVGDIDVTNGAAGNLATSDNITFTADITPAADGTVTVNIAADVAQDLGSNANLAATEFSIVYDVTAPTVGIDAITTNDQTPALTGTIDDNTATVSVAVGEATNEATNNGNGTWTLADNTLPELAEGGYTITVSATDEAGNQSEDASAQLTIDLTDPQVFFFDDNLGQFTVPVNVQPLRVYFTFSEAVTAVTVDDIIVEGNAGTAELLYVEAEMYYTLTIPLLDPAIDQEVAVTLPDGAVQDLAGNGNAAASITVAFDATGPSVTVNALSTNDQTPELTGTIDDNAATINVTVGEQTHAATNNGDGTWTLADNTLSALADGTYDVVVSATDASGNVGTDDAIDELVIDLTAPIIAVNGLSTDDQTPALTGTIDDNAASINVAVGEQTHAATNNGNGTWTLADNTLPELAEGEYTITVSATDEVGNQSEDASAQLTIDLTGPQIFFFDDNLGQFTVPVNEQPLRVNFTFSEAVTSVTVDDIIVEGNAGTAELLYVEAEMYYTLTIPLLDPATDQSVTVTMPEGSVQDLAGNGNATASITVAFDATGPSVTVNALSTNDQTPELTGNIDDNAATINVTVGEQTHAATNNGDGTWTLTDNTLSALADGTYDVVVSATDASGNVGTDDTIDELVIDLTAPIIAVNGLSTNDQTPALTGTIDDNAASINVAVGEQTHAATNNGDGTWTLADNTLSSLAEAEYTVSAVATDALGNQSEEATALLTIDLTGPQILFDNANLDGLSSFTDPVNISPLIVNIFFTEEATGLTLGEITIDGNVGTTGLSEAQESGVNFYMLAVPLENPDIDQQITITIPAGAAEDAAGNPNAEGSVTISYDVTGPSVNSISTIGYSTTNVSPIAVQIVFSEEITELTADDFTLGNGTIAVAPSSDDNITFTLDITPADEGLVTIQLLTDVVEDLAGNTNTLGTGVLEMTYDITAPDVEITTESENTASSPIVATVTFSEAIDEVTTGNFTITNGTATSISAVDAGIYTLEVTPNAPAEGSTSTSGIEVTIALAAGKVQDAARNGNKASNSLTVNFDDQEPVFNIFNDSNEPLTAVSGNFTANFIITESVEGFDINDINVTNGTKSNFRSESVFGVTRYRVDIALTGSEGVTITIPAEAVTDAAGNANIETTFSIGVDNTGPTVTISSSASSPTNANPIPVTFTFSEKITGFAIADIVANNFAVTSTPASEDNITFTTEISPSANGELTIALKEASVQDIAGNNLTNTGSLSITFDDTAPTVGISGPDGVNSTEAFQLTFTFSENVEGFTMDDIAVTNATKANFSGSGAVYTVAITPSGAGTVTVSVAEKVATDAAGNQNAVGAQKSVSFDNTRPTVAITGAPTAPVKSKDPVTLTFTFSEVVTGFALEDIAVTNGTKANFAGSGAAYTADISPTAPGDVAISLTENIAVDAAGNGNEAGSVAFTYEQKYSGGSGTEADPYLIATEADLRAISGNTGDHSAHFLQTADIEMSDEPYIPIGFDVEWVDRDGEDRVNFGQFSGTYDGGGFRINGLRNIQDVLFAKPDFSGISKNRVKGFIGIAGNAVLKNISLTSINIEGSVTSAGGLIGALGGVLGNDNTIIENCMVTGIINTSKGDVGGLVGEVAGPVTVKNSFTDISINAVSAAGLVNIWLGNAQIVDSYSLCNVTNTNPDPFNYTTSEFGGVATAGFTVDLTNTFFAGHVGSGFEEMGGLLRGFVSGSIKNSFWDKDLSGIETNPGGGTGLSTAEMYQRTTYTGAGWDLENSWNHIFGYPLLKWQADRHNKPFTVSGKVLDENGNPFTAGQVNAFSWTSGSKSVVPDASGNFTLDLDAGSYYLSVFPNDVNAYERTFLGNTKRLDRAKLVFYDNIYTIKMIARSQANLLDGNGRVSGKVVKGANGARIVQGRVLDGDPLEGVAVMLIRTSDGQVMTTVETDANGDFEITGIPAGDYQLVLGVAGLDLNLEGSTFTMDEEGTPLVISAAIGEEGIIFAIEEVLGVEDEIALSIYPNPAENQVNVLGKGKLIVRLLSLSGNTLAEKQFVDQTAVDLSLIPHGVYLLEIVNDSQQRTVKRLMKSN